MIKKLRNYFVGEELKKGDLLDRSRVNLIFNLTIFSCILTMIIVVSAALAFSWEIAIRAFSTVILCFLFLFISKKTEKISYTGRFLVFASAATVFTNIYFLFQTVDYSIIFLFLATVVLCFIIFSRKEALIWVIGMSILLVIAPIMTFLGISWTEIEPIQLRPMDQVVASTIGFILLVYVLWQFDHSVQKFSHYLREENDFYREAKREAEKMNKLKSSFLANMSHEIRTPLNGIMGISEILKSQSQDPDLQNMVNIQIDSSKRLLNTISSILELSRMEAESDYLQMKDIKIRKLITSTTDLLVPLASKRGNSLTYLIEDPDISCYASEDLMHQILNNIIGNAIKFTENGAIKILSYAEGKYAIIEISDNGIGISEDFLPKLFESFSQESHGLDRNYEGSGLGLSISYKYMQMIGGTIEVESEKGKGSTFRLKVPMEGD